MIFYMRFWRGISKSGVFILLGFVLLFLVGTQKTFFDWNTEYNLYVLIGGCLSTFIGLILFIRNFSGPLASKEVQIDDFLFQHIAPEDKRQYLAVGALYSLHPYRTVECLQKFFLQTPEDLDKGRKNIAESWGIVDHDTAKQNLDWLLQAGHRNDKKTLKEQEDIISQLKGHLPLNDDLSELLKNIKKIAFSTSGNSNDSIQENSIYSFTTISGWDYIRGASIAKDCYNLGYLTEEEAWEYLISFGKLVKNDFSSWEQLTVSFLIGRYLWSGDPVQEWYIEHFSWLFSFYPEDQVDNFHNNIWKKYSIDEL